MRTSDRYSRGAGELAGAVGEPRFRVWLEDWSAEEIEKQACSGWSPWMRGKTASLPSI
jgi:predicted secreted hydrolase